MAYAAVASVSETIDIVLKYHRDSIISHEFEVQMKSVQKHSVFFRSFLEEFRERGNNWDETIREVTDRAEDIIETTTSGGSRSRSSSSSSKCETDVNYSFGDLERIIEEMESITNRLKGKYAEAAGGVDEELMEIISRLREGSSLREVIAIVGMGGMGKAALAKNAYHHPLTVEYFEIRAWCTISQDYSPRGIIVELLRCMKLAEPDESISESENEMMLTIYKNLRGRRYLIVVNDMWDIEAWDILKHMFHDDGNGSRIIITTRLSNVCEAVKASYIHQIRLLDEDRAWNLVRQNVFRGDPCPSQLELVGKMIARTCRGHPLCIQMVSGMLAAADHTLSAWEDILENINMNINANEDDDYYLMNVLDLSYTYLPHHLKPCFLYFGCFPEGHEIRVSRLVKLWVAEGFVSENIGEEHLEDLVRRGLVSVTKTKSNGSTIKSVAIHELMRYVCMRQARINNFNYAVLGRYVDAVELLLCRRVTTSDVDDFRDIIEGVYGSTIRTIILSSDATRFRYLRCSIGNVRLLRVLDVLNVYYYNDLADQVFELFHLRYLAFRCKSKLSAAISNLQNLQTLIILPNYQNDDGMFDNLADGIWKMPQLRHLFVFHLNLPTQILGEMPSALEDLQTLYGVVNFICSREYLKLIPNLKKLDLLYKPTDVVQDYELHNLIYLHKLQTLRILMNRFFVRDYEKHFAFPPSLNKLTLCGLQLPWEDIKTVASLPNLQVLKLRRDACMGDTWETSEGGFSQLIYLLIEDSNLVTWKSETSHFPKLKQLVLCRCPSLLEVPDGLGKIQTLELIELDEENHSLLSSVNRIHKDRQSSGDDRLHIRVV